MTTYQRQHLPGWHAGLTHTRGEYSFPTHFWRGHYHGVPVHIELMGWPLGRGQWAWTWSATTWSNVRQSLGAGGHPAARERLSESEAIRRAFELLRTVLHPDAGGAK